MSRARGYAGAFAIGLMIGHAAPRWAFEVAAGLAVAALGILALGAILGGAHRRDEQLRRLAARRPWLMPDD